MQVDANVSEGDIGGVKLNNTVLFSVDAFPDRTFQGRITQIRQSPQTVQNVVTYDVVASVDNTDLALKPGMTAAVRVIIEQHDGVLRVPSQALRYTPKGAMRSDTGHPRIWVQRGSQLVAIDIKTALSDNDYVEVSGGDLKTGDEVVTAEHATAAATPPRP